MSASKMAADILDASASYQRSRDASLFILELHASLQRHVNRGQEACSAGECEEKLPGAPYGIAYGRGWTMVQEIGNPGANYILCPIHSKKAV